MQLMEQVLNTPASFAALRQKLDELEAAAVPVGMTVTAGGVLTETKPPQPIDTMKNLSRKKQWTPSDTRQALAHFNKHLPPSMVAFLNNKL
jgi:hypothetical protein